MTDPGPPAAIPFGAVRVDVAVPGLLRSYTGGQADVALDVPAAGGRADLAAALGALDARFPGLRFRIVDEQGHVRPHIRLFVDRAEARALDAPLPLRCRLLIVGALSGG
jgi:hypothetical protein